MKKIRFTKSRRVGLGKGKGKGYKNIIPKDHPVHVDSGHGRKQPQRIPLDVKNFIERNPDVAKKILQGRTKLDDMVFNDDAVEVVRTKKGMVRIFQDDNPEDPRGWDNLGTMFFFHNRYNLGDSHPETSDSFGGWGEIKDYLVKEKKAEILFPVYMYDHSGLRVKIGSFQGLLPQGHAEFDSGMVGYIYITKDDIRKGFGVKKVTDKEIKRAEEVLRTEVKIYDQYLSGDVWGYQSYNNKGEEVDSCWGFYGMDTAITEGSASLK